MRKSVFVPALLCLGLQLCDVSFGNEPTNPFGELLLEKIAGQDVSFLDVKRLNGILDFRFRSRKFEGDTHSLDNGDEWTPLTAAIRTEQFDLAILMLCSGADPNFPTGRGYSPIWLLSASAKGNTYQGYLLASALLVVSADVMQSPYKISEPPSDVTAIHMAGQMGNAELLKLFHSAGVNLGVHDSSGRSPLDYAKASTAVAEKRVSERVEQHKRAVEILKRSMSDSGQSSPMRVIDVTEAND